MVSTCCQMLAVDQSLLKTEALQFEDKLVLEQTEWVSSSKAEKTFIDLALLSLNRVCIRV